MNRWLEVCSFPKTKGRYIAATLQKRVPLRVRNFRSISYNDPSQNRKCDKAEPGWRRHIVTRGHRHFSGFTGAGGQHNSLHGGERARGRVAMSSRCVRQKGRTCRRVNGSVQTVHVLMGVCALHTDTQAHDGGCLGRGGFTWEPVSLPSLPQTTEHCFYIGTTRTLKW